MPYKNKKYIKDIPNLLDNWDYKRNILSPDTISVGSDKKVWWKCDQCGNSYEMSVAHKHEGNGCPYCSNKRILEGFNDLNTKFPNIAKEWDYEKNSGLLPTQVAPFSNKKVWWKCPNGHSYQMMINNRTGKKGQDCPICVNRIIVVGINDLSTTNPELIDKWDYEKNKPLTPQMFSAGSNKYVYWVCEKGHSFKSRIHSMTHSLKGMNCPICRNTKVVHGFNDLATTNPDLLEEWDYEKNTIKPTEIYAGSNLKVWWKCKEHGHSWCVPVQLRAKRGLGCPYCSHTRLLSGFNDVGTLYPSILKEWDYDKNHSKTPSDFIGIYSNKQIWLKCEKGHSYKSTIGSFCRGNRCPYCSNKKVLVGFNDLSTTHPELSKQWNYKKNDPLTPQMFTYGSDKKVWWLCEHGHSWQATINSRVAGKGCPKCLKEYQTSLTEKVFAYYLSKYFFDLKENVHLKELNRKELDIYIPSIKLAVEYDGHAFHRNVKRDLEKDNLCAQNGIILIRIREEGCPRYDSVSHFIDSPRNHGNILTMVSAVNNLFSLINKLFGTELEQISSIEKDLSSINETFYSHNKENSLINKCPQLLEEWDYEKNGDLKPDFIQPGSNSKVWWRCKNGHSWAAVVSSRVRGNGCPYCSGKYVLQGSNDFATKYPQLLKEWDYDKNKGIDPTKIHENARQAVYWKCEHGHSWKTSVATRTRMGAGCPVCSGLVADKGKNDLQTLYPDIAAEWDYEKNGDLKPSDFKPGSEKKVWWKCPKGHSYQNQIFLRVKTKCGCPYCSNRKVLKGFNDLETLHPELAKEWDYDKNNGLLPSQVSGAGGSHKRVWWKCKNGHCWEAVLTSRIRLRTGCPICAIERNKKTSN